jgi:hypothetical protein
MGQLMIYWLYLLICKFWNLAGQSECAELTQSCLRKEVFLMAIVSIRTKYLLCHKKDNVKVLSNLYLPPGRSKRTWLL